MIHKSSEMDCESLFDIDFYEKTNGFVCCYAPAALCNFISVSNGHIQNGHRFNTVKLD